jgi:ectoine hydroxylase-related dioxygenase (phytanoyl-CoA dioxygenase family)
MTAAHGAPPAVCAELHAQGFCVLPNLVPTTKLARIAAVYDRAFSEAAAPDLKTSSTGGCTRLADFVSRSAEFDELYVLEPVLSACAETIGPQFKLSSFHGRTVLPGAAAQALHVDVRRDEDAWPLLGFIVMVDEFRAGNGATRFAPGTHTAEDDAAHDGNSRPERRAELACGPPGSVVVYHGSTWHGYSSNDSAAPRRSIQGAYIPRSAAAALDWAARVHATTAQRLSTRARQVLALD